MSKRTISLIIALFFITIIFLWIALSNSSSTQTTNVTTKPPSPTPTPYAQTSLNLSPGTIAVPVGNVAQQTVDVMMTTGANDVTGVQLELSYDPKALTNVSVAQGTMFQNPLMFTNKVDTTMGRISYVYVITPSQMPQKGSGTVAVITFTPLRNPVDANGQKITQTMIQLLPKTLVTARGVDQSVLMPSSFTNEVTVTFPTTTTSTSQQYVPAQITTKTPGM